MLVAKPACTQGFLNCEMDINVVFALPTQSGEDKNRPGNSDCMCMPVWEEAEGWPFMECTGAHNTKNGRWHLSLSNILTASESPAEPH